MTSKFTREELLNIINTDHVQCGEASALARMALAAMDSEPVAWTDEQELRDVDRGGCGYLFTVNHVTPHADERRIILLYRHAQPASEREQVRSAHAEWSQATFGNVGPVGPLKHLSKEALEAAEQPGDLSEWADMQFLLWDAQRRAGITDDQITQAMIDKLAVNKQRSWPEPKDGEPRLHIKAQPAPVVPEEATPDSIEILASARRRDRAVFQWDEDQRNAAADSWNACRAAMLRELQKSAGAEETCRSNENVQVLTTINPAPVLDSLPKNAESLTGNSTVIGIDLASGPDRTVEVHYVAPPGYVMVPKEPTEAMMLHNSGCQHHAWDDPDCAMRQTRRLIWSHMLAAAPQEVKGE